MKLFRLSSLLLFAGLLVFAGCKYVDTTPLPTGSQALNITVGWPSGLTLPDDAVITVRLLDVSRDDLPLYEQSMAHMVAQPVAFQLAYQAEDIQPPHRTRLEARVAFGGKLRLISSRQNYFVTPANAATPFALTVSALAGAAPLISGPLTDYVVKTGDTAAIIVQENGITLHDLIEANPAVDWDKLKVSQKINLPPKP